MRSPDLWPVFTTAAPLVLGMLIIYVATLIPRAIRAAKKRRN